MINLFNYIKESIFDDDDEQLEKVDAQVMIHQIKDSNSPFRQEYLCYDLNSRFAPKNIEKAMFDNGVLTIPTHNVVRDTRGKEAHSLSYFFPSVNIRELRCLTFTDKHRCELTADNLCKKVTCSNFKVDITEKVKDIEIELNPKLIEKETGLKSNTLSRCSFDGPFKPILENVSINFVNYIAGGNMGKQILFHDWPILKNFKTNANVISVYDPMAFDDDDLDKIFNIFEWPLKVMVRDHKTGEDREIVVKGLKKAKAIANNYRRYTPLTQVFKLKPNAKLSDVLDTSGMSDLHMLMYRDNKVDLRIIKEPEKSMLNCEPEPLKTDTHQCTKDGYYVYLQHE